MTPWSATSYGTLSPTGHARVNKINHLPHTSFLVPKAVEPARARPDLHGRWQDLQAGGAAFAVPTPPPLSDFPHRGSGGAPRGAESQPRAASRLSSGGLRSHRAPLA